MEKPDGIVITISQKYLKERGIKNWLTDFFNAMNNENWTYWMRLGNRPKQEVLYIYLIMFNKVKFRFNFVMYENGGEFKTSDGRTITANTFLIGCGPLVKATKTIYRKGFQGFRYTEFIF